MAAQERRHRVAVVGGGFAGLFAVRALRRGPFAVTLIDRSEHHLFQPLLYQCATGILSEGQIAEPLRRVLRRHDNVEIMLAEAVDVDVTRRRVICRRPLGDQVDVPDRVPEPGRGDLDLVGRVHPRHPPGARVHLAGSRRPARGLRTGRPARRAAAPPA
jgi:NADPH-dependent 2,4-dienoyl-CoA reductase/sulfur reductase-like enzyme